MNGHRKRRFLIVTLILALVLPVLASPVGAAGFNSQRLRNAVTVNGILAHAQAFQSIANNTGGTRASGTSGYQQSVNYVASKMAAVGYKVTLQPFEIDFFQEVTPAILEQTAPTPTSYATSAFTYSGSGDVTAQVQNIDLLLPPTGGSTSGCEASDFNSSVVGRIALIQRGTCPFATKAQNALAAGAVAVIIFNEGNLPEREELFIGDIATPGFTIPVVGASFADGNALAAISGLTMRVKTETISEVRTTYNVIADTKGGNQNKVVVIGAHLDSVAEGPGINDNVSGVATILEIATQMVRQKVAHVNAMRFIFWGGEELNLLGSDYYIEHLSAQDRARIALYLNFDMVGSPNFVRYVYDGSEDPINPTGSGAIEDLFLDYFGSMGLATEPTSFDGRSDYGPFIAIGIPAGGLFTGAEGIKTAPEAAVYGGTAGVAYDECYHEACDTIANLSTLALDQMSDAAAHVVMYYATLQVPKVVNTGP